MKETKTVRMEIRLTPTEKQIIQERAKAKGITLSQMIRELCEEIFKEAK